MEFKNSTAFEVIGSNDINLLFNNPKSSIAQQELKKKNTTAFEFVQDQNIVFELPKNNPTGEDSKMFFNKAKSSIPQEQSDKTMTIDFDIVTDDNDDCPLDSPIANFQTKSNQKEL